MDDWILIISNPNDSEDKTLEFGSNLDLCLQTQTFEILRDSDVTIRNRNRCGPPTQTEYKLESMLSNLLKER
jgi:hypothetical protein